MINQLFITKPPNELIIECLCSLGFNDLLDSAFISKETMKLNRSVDIIKNKKPELEKYYSPTKAKQYLDNLDVKKCITVVRQLIKTIGYDLISKEKMSSGNKILYYRIVTIKEKYRIKRIKSKKLAQPAVIVFD